MATSSPPFAALEERLSRLPELLLQGNLEEASQLCTEILAAAPGHPTAEYFMGIIALERDADRDAEDAFRRTLLHAPEAALRAAAWQGLARLYQKRQELERAEEALRKAFEADPNDPRQRAALAEILITRGRHEEAIALLQASLRTDPHDGVAWGLLAQALTTNGRYEEALRALDRCETLLGARAQERAETVGLRARIALIRGDLETARRIYRDAIERDPTYPGYGPLAELHQFSAPEDPLLTWLEARHRSLDARASREVRADLAYALGKAWEEAGNPAKSFSYYREGAALLRPPHAAERVTRHLERHALLRERFDRQVLESLASHRPREGIEGDFVPVFIVGLPRGGSTLLEQMLAAHPDVAAGGELPYGLRLCQGLLATWYARGELPPTDLEVAGHELSSLAARYAELTREFLHGRKVLTDKALANYEYVGILATAMPNAVFLHIHKENVLDQCWGMYRRRFAPGAHEYTYDLEDLARMWRSYQTLVNHWHAQLPPGRLVDVAYERLIRDPEETLRPIFERLGLDFDPACLHPERVERPITTASLVQARAPLNEDRIGRAAAFLPWLEPLQRALSEETTVPSKP